ncbi:MAG: D-alanyl-D-alanine carboxypeptidase [Syntrophomonadaceae bacterium]|nr:D-alanyl-D-alanine carboxypeptidase [Syntrophomonadaceae bacterium]
MKGIRLKQQYYYFLKFFFILTLILVVTTSKAYALEEPKLEDSVSAAILMDAKSGQILYAYNPNVGLPIASTTKIMTGLLVLEHANLDASVVVSENAARIEGSKIYLEPGEVHRVEDLLYAMLLNSANDVATCLAEYVGGGSLNVFIEMMNQRALSLGALNTHFNNPTGLTEDGHYSTAYDLALITREALQNPQFRKIVATRTRPWVGKNHQGTLLNLNRLLGKYPGLTGVKTGYTVAAQKCLVASAEREGQELISVILGSGNAIWQQSEALLDYGFASYKPSLLVEANQVISHLDLSKKRSVNLLASRSLQVSLPRNRDLTLVPQIQVESGLTPPLSAGMVAGYLIYEIEGQPLEPIPLLIAEDVPKEGLFQSAVVTRTTPIVLTAGGLLVFSRLIGRRRALKRRRLRRRSSSQYRRRYSRRDDRDYYYRP